MQRHALELVTVSALLLCEQLTPAHAQQTGAWLGRERGPFDTGTVEEVWIDTRRDEAQSPSTHDRRHLTIQIWYPAEPAGREPIAVYATNIDDYDESVKETWGVAARRPTRSHVGAPLADEQQSYPIVLYSHGFGNPSFTGTFQTEFLASHGYIVVSIGHTGWDGRVRFPGGYRFERLERAPEPDAPEDLPPIRLYRLAGKSASLQAVYATGLSDIEFVIDKLERLQNDETSRFHQRLDLSSIAGLGFSTGGALYIQATIEEPRLDAAANMDGGLNGLSVLAEGARRPILLVRASDNYASVSNGPADAGMEEFFVEVQREIWQMLRLSSSAWAKATITGTMHPHFSDAPVVAPAMAESTNLRRVHGLSNRLVLEFFDRHLKGRETAPILDHEITLDRLQLVTKRQAD